MEVDMQLAEAVYERATELFFEQRTWLPSQCVDRAAEDVGTGMPQTLRNGMAESLETAMKRHFFEKLREQQETARRTAESETLVSPVVAQS